MPGIDRRGAIAGIGMLLVAAAGAAANPRRRLADELPPLDLEASIPLNFGDWRIDKAIPPVLPAPDVQESLDKLYSRILSRTYMDLEGRRIMFVIAYGADQAERTTLAHLPRSCYSSQGFEVSRNMPVSIPVQDRYFGVVRLRTRRGARIEPVTYWTTVGERAFNDDIGRRWARARYTLRGIIPDGMLVRVSSINANEDEAFEMQAAFVAQMYSSLSAQTRARVFGSAV